MRFSERVERRASALTVLDASGRRVDRDDAQVDPTDPTLFSVTVSELPPGVYTVSWRVLSADDGHLTEGAHGFVVGGGAGRPAPARVRAVTAPLLPFGRWLALAGAVMVLGVSVFGRWLRSAADAADQERRMCLAGVAVLIVGELVRLFALHRQTGSSFLATTAGQLVVVELGVAIALGVALLAAPHGRTGQALVIALAAVVLVAGAGAGHGAAAGALAPLAIPAHALHLLAVAAWVGGLGYLATLFWAALRDSERLPAVAAALPRFSLAATAAVGALALTGLGLARLHLASARELVATPYGLVLVAKLAIVGVMLALAAYHRFVARRRLALGPSARIVNRLCWTLRAEAGAGMVALLLGAILGTTAPPAPRVEGEATRFRRDFTADGVTVALEAWPLHPGHNRVRVRATDAAGQPLADARAALLQLTPGGGGVGPSASTLEPVGPGVFETGHLLLGLAGPWRGRLVVQREGAYDVNLTFEVTVGPEAGPSGGRRTPFGPATGLGALAIVVVTLALVLDARRELSRAPRSPVTAVTAADPAAQEVPR